MTLKLYKFKGSSKKYWETWDDGSGNHTVHWGNLGEKGQTKTIKNSLFKKAATIIQADIKSQIEAGFNPIEDLHCLLIEYKVDDFGTPEELEKRHRLQDRMDETLGWTGLGHCDGGSVGSGSMEVCNFVVDVEIAKSVIAEDLKGTEFADYTRIFVES